MFLATFIEVNGRFLSSWLVEESNLFQRETDEQAEGK
jgi:hypothetical protein